MDYLGESVLDAGEVFDVLVRSTQSRELRGRLVRERARVIGGSRIYTAVARRGFLGQLVASRFKVPSVSPGEMVALYERLRKNQHPRTIYTSLLRSNEFNRCAYCSDRDAFTLDHYLAKASFGVFSVLPCNLVPACTPCNVARATREKKTGTTANTLHPQFDDTTGTRWLRARIVDRNGPVARLYADTAAVSTPYLRARAAEHLTTLNLKKYFKVKAAQELAGLERTLPVILSEHGQSEVIKELRTQARQRAAGRTNCWELALFEALAEDEWYLATYLPRLVDQVVISEDIRRPIPLA